MRIINQDGTIDLPYEEVVVAIPYNDTCMVIASPVPDIATKPYWEMAEYDTAEEAINAMDLLHMAYASGEKTFRFPEHVDKQDVTHFSELIYKNTAKEPIYDGDGYAPDGSFVWDEWLCPNCGTRYEVDYDDYDYCPNCGQAIKWEGV